MPEETFDDKQKQINHILKRWRKTNSLVTLIAELFLIMTFYVLLVMGLLKICGQPSNPFIVFIIPILVSPLCIKIAFFLSKKRRAFLQQLTEEEKALLERAANHATQTERKVARQVLQIYENVRLRDEKILLRASQQTQDDTLLRAAKYTETAPQDQLLRPTTNLPKTKP